MLQQEIANSFNQFWTLTLDLLEGDDSRRHVPRMVPCLGRAGSESRRRQDADKKSFEHFDSPKLASNCSFNLDIADGGATA
jgi:hypothetical protein